MADEQAGWLAAEKMVEKGYSRILAVMGSKTMSITQRREKGLKNYLSANAPGVILEIIYADNGESIDHLLESYFVDDRKGSIIFSMSDEILCGTLRFLNGRNMKFPDDISLLTISNGFLPSLFHPEISYVETNGKKLGKLAFSRMKEIMDGKKFIKENLLDCHYFPGGSM
jgi:LacI family transcriptional regulator